MYVSRDGRFTRITLLLFFIVIASYAIYEAQGMLLGPIITVTDERSIFTQDFVILRGKAEHIATLSMNGEPIAVTEEGVFAEPYVLAPGLNHVYFDATDKYGRKRHKVLELVYDNSSQTPKSEVDEVIASSTEESATSTSTAQ